MLREGAPGNADETNDFLWHVSDKEKWRRRSSDANVRSRDGRRLCFGFTGVSLSG